ncbi:hypothetical protein [Fangia hongkongensis]|uniref:hypothetical protein n=1 Tax=Fangia hongkongensis TaxID=270495 RepID=UPI00037AC29D|nr:hypothetical protein [Fangia hongkongensis]MBK2124222.1 hypothetical protein [Fangia hongkongensis]
MKGYIQAFLYIFVISFSTVWVSHLGDNISIPLLLFGVSIVAMLFFNLIRLRYIIKNHQTIVKSPFLWLSMTISMLLVWWCSYYTAVHASASFSLAILFLWQAIVAAIVKKRRFVVSLSLVIWFLIYWLAPDATPLTLVTATLSGIMAYLYYYGSLAYAKRHDMTALDILTIRFYPICLFSLIYIVIDVHRKVALYTNSTIQQVVMVLLLLGLINMVLPNFCSQNSVQNIGAEQFSFITTFIPPFTFLIQGVFLGTWSISLLVACILTSIILNIDVCVKYAFR